MAVSVGSGVNVVIDVGEDVTVGAIFSVEIGAGVTDWQEVRSNKNETKRATFFISPPRNIIYWK
jgi:hypothetical protein